MTTLTRPVIRETGEIDWQTRRPFVLRLELGGRLVRIRPKGKRTWYTVTVKQIYQLGAANKAQEDRLERQRRREERRKQRANANR